METATKAEADMAKDLAEARKEIDRLKSRVAERARQEKAKWLVVAYLRCTEAEAHRRLMHVASVRHMKLETVVDRLATIADAIENVLGEVD